MDNRRRIVKIVAAIVAMYFVISLFAWAVDQIELSGIPRNTAFLRMFSIVMGSAIVTILFFPHRKQ
jgi:preprotein translocase subunit SecE